MEPSKRPFFQVNVPKVSVKVVVAILLLIQLMISISGEGQRVAKVKRTRLVGRQAEVGLNLEQQQQQYIDVNDEDQQSPESSTQRSPISRLGAKTSNAKHQITTTTNRKSSIKINHNNIKLTHQNQATNSNTSNNSNRNQRTQRIGRSGESLGAASSDPNDSKCGLILQRTYVRRTGQSRDLYFETIDNVNVDIENLDSNGNSSVFQATDKKERICITYGHINAAVAEAKQRRKFQGLSEDQVNSIEPKVPIVAQLGELNQEITKILSTQFDLSHDEIQRGLPMIDMSRTDLWPQCPLMVRPVECDPTGRFRSFTGHCNNLKNPTWGAAQTPFVRFIERAHHPDGIQEERRSVLDDSPLPSPRLVTSIVHRDHDQPSGDLSLLIMVWGQIIDHDLALAAPPRGKFIIIE